MGIDCFFGISILEITTIVAILVGPIAAVFITRWIDHARRKKERRISIFRDLMKTRQLRTHWDHVVALNLIELEFYGDEKVINSYRAYIKHLSKISPTSDDEAKSFSDERDDLYVNFLCEVGKCVGYSFDKHDLQRLSYIPYALGRSLDVQNQNTFLLNEIMLGEKSLSVFIANSESEAQKNSHETNS